MGFTLHVVFYGLVAFVPTSQNGSEYMALLPQTAGGQYASDGCHLREHRPMMFIQAQSCQQGQGGCKKVAALDHQSKVYENVNHDLFYVPLEGQDLVIQSSASGSLQSRPSQYGHMPQTTAEATDPHWLPSYPGKKKVNPDCIASDGGSYKTCPVTARVTIDNATPATCHLITTTDGNSVCAYRFRSRHEWWPFDDMVQAIADGTSFTASIAEAELDLRLGPLWSSPGPPLVLKPGNDGITIWIAELVVEDDQQSTPGCDDEAEVDHHFEIYYDLLARDWRGMPLSIDKRPAPADQMECGGVDTMEPIPAQRCPDIPAQPKPAMEHIQHLTDLSGCGHTGQMMLSQ